MSSSADRPGLGNSNDDTGLSAEQFQMLVDGVIEYSIYMLSPQGLVSSWNNGAKRIKGYDSAEIVGQHFSRFFTPEDQLAGKPNDALATATAVGRFEAEGIRVRKDGSHFWAHVVMDAITDDDRNIIGFAKITRDITRQKEDADRIQNVTRTLNLALANIVQGLCLFDAAGNLMISNQQTNEIFGVGANATLPGTPFSDLIATLVARSSQPDELSAQTEAQHIVRRHQDLIRRGERRTVLENVRSSRTVSIMHRGLADGGWLTTFEDVTERRRAELKIAHMAHHDGLTGLPNRLNFNEYLKEELRKADRGQQQVGIICIDLDRFKDINDLQGHAMGDTVLTTLATRMQGLLQENEFVARIGGDEFAAVVRFNDPSSLHDFVRRLEACLLSPLVVEDLSISVGASFGVAIFPTDADSSEQLVKNSDLAMYRAKADFGRSVCFYEAQMEEVVRSKRAMASDLWKAIERQDFVIAYQVQKSIPTGEAVGCEALLRWQHPERGLIAPDDFIPIAEECGAIIPIGQWVLRQACTDATGWPAALKVAVNISPLQLQDGLPPLIKDILMETGLPAGRLELEITESTIIADKLRSLEILWKVKRLGVTIALDDFGTGYSSLDTLKSFPFDKIKLDRIFMLELPNSLQAKAVVRAILALGHALSMPVLAEGVETEAQLSLLRFEGCDEAQGFLLGRPTIGSISQSLS